jgi:hypothetical protein
MCKELPVIPVNKVVNPKRIIGKMEGRGEGEAQGVADQEKKGRDQLFGETYVVREKRHSEFIAFLLQQPSNIRTRGIYLPALS